MDIDEAMEMVEELSARFPERTIAFDGNAGEVIVEAETPLDLRTLPRRTLESKLRRRGFLRARKLIAERRAAGYRNKDCVVGS